jgi:hypothetical protein
MSRSNPQDHLQNPATRWFEWNGERGEIRYYDKELKKNVEVPLPFTFLLLDEVATVRGWHDPQRLGYYANEVRDATTCSSSRPSRAHDCRRPLPRHQADRQCCRRLVRCQLLYRLQGR